MKNIIASLFAFFVLWENVEYRTVPCGDWAKQENRIQKDVTLYLSAACVEKKVSEAKVGPFKTKKQAEEHQVPFFPSRIVEIK